MSGTAITNEERTRRRIELVHQFGLDALRLAQHGLDVLPARVALTGHVHVGGEPAELQAAAELR